MYAEVTRRRFAVGSYVNGRWVDGSTTDVTIIASVQPVKSSELLLLPEGLRTKGAIKAYCEEDLQTANEATGRPADQIYWDGEWWEVQVSDRHALGLCHYKALCVRLER